MVVGERKQIWLSVLLMLGLTAMASATFDTSVNIVINGGFENDGDSWFTGGGTIDDTVSNEGQQSGQLDAIGNLRKDWRSIKYPAVAGQAYQLVFDYLTSVGATGQPEIRFRFFSFPEVFRGEAQQNLDPTNGQWQTASVSLTTPELASIMDVFFTVNTFGTFNGVVWLDNVRIHPDVDGTVALHPDPEDGQTNVPLDEVLDWDAPLDFPTTANYEVFLVSEDVFDPNDPNSLGVTPLAVITDPNDSSYDPPGDLEINKTYYWRIDTINTDTSDRFTGPVWSFTTVPPKAVNPDPTDGQTGVSLLQILGWSAVPGADSYDVYLGTDQGLVTAGDNSVNQGNQAGTTFDADLEFETQYFWRIDTLINSVTSVGDVWTFTTAGPECDPPLQGDINDDCIVNIIDFTLLSFDWLACTLTNAVCP